MKELLRKLKKYRCKRSIQKHEKAFNRIKFCFYPERKSDSLVIVYSGFPGGKEAKYNYINTLASVKVNKLFLLDDVWNPVSIGSYYLGEKGDWYFISDICHLVSEIAKSNRIKKIITAGSSKGGTAALFYGVMIGADAVVIGAPQYYIGSYLSSEKHQPILEAIMGDVSQASVARLDSLIQSEIKKEHNRKPIVYIHYSPLEHTYDNHIRDMIDDLSEKGFTVIEDKEYQYENHSDVAKFFPRYMFHTIKKLVKQQDEK